MRAAIRTVQGLKHRKHGNFAGRANQLMTALRPPGAANQTGAAKRSQHLMEIGLGDVLPVGDLPTLDRPLPVVLGEVKKRSNSVIRPT